MKPARHPDPSGPPRYLLRRLLEAYYWYDESLQNLLRTKGAKPLSRAQSMIMVNLSSGVRRPAELARQLGISRQAIQQSLAGMIRANLVEYRDDPQDRRAKIIDFSARGRGIVKTAFSSISEVERELSKRIGPTAMQALEKALYAEWGKPMEPPATSTPSVRQPSAAGARRARRGPAKPKR